MHHYQNIFCISLITAFFLTPLVRRLAYRLGALDHPKAHGIQTRIVRGSDLPAAGEATERLVNLCKAVKGTEYLTGAFAAGAYLEPELFERAGIKLVTQEFQAPEYAQQYPAAGFAPEMSVLDLLLNCGPRSLEILMGTAGGDSPRFRQGLSSKAPE